MSDNRTILMEEILERRVVVAFYGNSKVRPASHQLVQRHGELFLLALNLSRAWRTPEEWRLERFKLAGLSAGEVLKETFEPLGSIESTGARPDEVLILAI